MSIEVNKVDEIGTREGNEDAYRDSFSEVYQVISDNGGITAIQAMTATGIPVTGDDHPDSPGSKVSKITARKEKKSEWGVWEVTVEYTQTDFDDPTDVPATIEFGSNQYTQVVEKGYNPENWDLDPAVLIENSALDPYDPPIQQPFSKTTINITQNVRIFDPDWKRTYENSINLSDIRIAGISVGQYQGRILSIKSTNHYDAENVLYWTVNYVIEIDREKHIKRILDAGFNYINDDGDEPVKAVIMVQNAPASDPQKLDGGGGILGFDNESGGPSDDPVYLTFYTYKAMDWTTLSLPADIIEEVLPGEA